MLKKRQRTIISHNALYSFISTPLLTIPRDMSVIHMYKKLRDILKEKQICYLNKKKTLSVFLHQVEISDDSYYATLLFSMRDKDGVDQATGKIAQKDITVHKKADTEGTAYSCHLVVTLEPDEHGHYYAFREYISGFSEKYLMSVINQEFKKLLTRPYETEERRIRNTHPKLILSARPSENLLDDIQNGQLSFLELTTTKPAKQLDRITESISEVRTLKIELSTQDTIEKLADGLDKLYKKYRPDEAKFHFKDSDRTYSVNVDGNEDVRDIVFAKKREAHVDTDIPQASETFHRQLKNKMLQFAKAETGVGVIQDEEETRTDTSQTNAV